VEESEKAVEKTYVIAYICRNPKEKTMPATTVTDFRANIASMLDRVTEDHVPLIITRTGKKNTVVVSEEDWMGMQETLYLMSSPANAERLLRSIDELNAGLGVVRELIEPAA
jgi:antitoxin YefM